GIVTHRSVRVGGDQFDEAIVQHVRRTYNLLIGERTAEEIKQTIGSVYPVEGPETMEVRGRDLVTGLPKTVTLSAEEVREAMAEPTGAIVDAVRMTLERTPPELAADVMDKGIMLAGGGSLIRGLDRLLMEETGMPVHIAEDPLTAVVRGTGTTLEHDDLLRRVAITSRKTSGWPKGLVGVRARGRAVAAVAGLLVLVLVAIIFLTSRPREGVSRLEAAFRDGLTPLFMTASRVTQAVAGLWDGAVALFNAHDENRRLREEVDALRREVARLEELARQNEALRAALDLPPEAPRPVIFAEVIARPLNNWWGVLTINKGRRHGVEPHMGVVAAHGAVGHIRSASAFSSEVILLSDPRSAVGAIVQRTGEPV